MTTKIPLEWLRIKGTPEEFERAQLERTATSFNLPLEKVVQEFGSSPFDVLTPNWRKFVGKLEPADELWTFSSPAEGFAKKVGCLGYAIVRDGIVSDIFVTLHT